MEYTPPPAQIANGRPQWRGLIEEYRDRLPVTESTPVITLREGGTPLIFSESLSELTGSKVWLKFEGANPTGSFKDRGMTMAMTKAVEGGAKAVICASTGNTSASAAAYASKAGITCGVIVPDGKIALGKLAQALITGAEVLQVKGNFDQALDICRELADNYPIVLVNSVNPYRIQGQKTGAFEVCDFLGNAPAVHVMPVGNAGNIYAYWMGYKEYFADKLITDLPVMRGFQAAGSAPIVAGHPIASPQTIATAIRIGNPASWEYAVDAAESSNGSIRAVTDRQILNAYRRLAKEGVFVEMGSASSVAGLLTLHENKELPAGENVVCVVTGHGLKDPDWAILSGTRPTKIEANVEMAAAKLGLA